MFWQVRKQHIKQNDLRDLIVSVQRKEWNEMVFIIVSGGKKTDLKGCKLLLETAIFLDHPIYKCTNFYLYFYFEDSWICLSSFLYRNNSNSCIT